MKRTISTEREIPAVDSLERVAPDEMSVGGAAPKDLLKDPIDGSLYIAKGAHRLKGTPQECFTEYAIYLAGRAMNVDVADARLGKYHGEVRFMSRYFLGPDDELVHGVQLFRELLSDEDVDGVLGDKQREAEMFTVRSIKAAFGAHYDSETEEALFSQFAVMLAHDAIIGLQDRHPENWGVIVQRKRSGSRPRLSPLYDSARGLFWDHYERHLVEKFRGQGSRQRLVRYVMRSQPLIGWERKRVNHFDLVARVFWAFPSVRGAVLKVLESFNWRVFLQACLSGLSGCLSPFRIDLMRQCLRLRVRFLRRALVDCPATPA